MSGRPEWFDTYLDYPHGALAEPQAREICWYAVSLENVLNEISRRHPVMVTMARAKVQGTATPEQHETKKTSKQ